MHVALQQLQNMLELEAVTSTMASAEGHSDLPAKEHLASSCDVLCALLDMLTSPQVWREPPLDAQLWHVALNLTVPHQHSWFPATPKPRLCEVLRSSWSKPTFPLAHLVSQRVFALTLNALGLSSEGATRLPPAHLRISVEAAFEQFALDMLCDSALELRANGLI